MILILAFFLCVSPVFTPHAFGGLEVHWAVGRCGQVVPFSLFMVRPCLVLIVGATAVSEKNAPYGVGRPRTRHKPEALCPNPMGITTMQDSYERCFALLAHGSLGQGIFGSGELQ